MNSLLLWLGLSTAGATELTVGGESVVNDPFLQRRSVVVGVSHEVLGPLRLGAQYGFAPDRGEEDWKPLTTQLVNENSVSPDISKYTMYGAIRMEVPVIRTSKNMARGPGGLRHLDTELRVFGGMGFARTTDDLEALQATGDERAVATQFQTHPTSHYGLNTTLYWSDRQGLRVEAEFMDYIETVNATTLEMKSNLIIGLEYIRALGSSVRDGSTSEMRRAQ